MLWSAFIVGILGSFHCVGMCGPIAFLLPLDRKSNKKRIFQVSLYHIGRLFAYSIIGFVFGVVGKSFSLFGLQQKISILIGIVMIVVVLVSSFSKKQWHVAKPIYKIISKIKSNLGSLLKKKSSDTFLTIGFLNGFLPCGLVYMAVFGAIASQSLWQGSLYMILFGLGTVPLMTTAVYFGNFLSGKVRQKITKAIPVFVIVIGVLFVLRGMGLGIPYVSPKQMKPKIESTQSCHSLSALNTMKK